MIALGLKVLSKYSIKNEFFQDLILERRGFIILSDALKEFPDAVPLTEIFLDAYIYIFTSKFFGHEKYKISYLQCLTCFLPFLSSDAIKSWKNKFITHTEEQKKIIGRTFLSKEANNLQDMWADRVK